MEPSTESARTLALADEAEVPPAWLRGVLIDGRYRVERVVGAGGFGVVYAAQHIGLGAKVALKVLEPREGLRAEQLAARVGSFLGEARTLKRLRHPNIVAALDVGFLPPDPSGQRLPYIVMEWCGGPTLRSVLERRRGRPMAVPEAWALFDPLLAAMEHAHRSGVAHRDLKPENIVLDATGESTFVPRVIDFGIAKIVASDDAPDSGGTRTASDARAFTPRYAAPEQLAGARTGAWTDVHALGLVFVELVTGRPALDGDVDAAMKRLDPIRPTPGTRGVDVGALEAVLVRALALRPSDRYADAAAFAGAMREAMGDAMRAGRARGDHQEGTLIEGAAASGDARPDPFAATVTSSVGSSDSTLKDGSATLQTRGSTSATAPSPSRRRRVGRWLAALAVAVAVAFGVGAVRRWRFAPQRLREVPVAEMERRLEAAGFGDCQTYGRESAGQTQHQITCERGTVIVLPGLLPPGSAAQDGPRIASAYARSIGPGGPAEIAIDGELLLVAFGAAARVGAMVDAAVGDALVDVRASAGDARPPPTEHPAAGALAAWSAADLMAAVQATGETVWTSDPRGMVPSVSVMRGKEGANLSLSANASLTLGALKAGQMPFAYAVDDDTLLLVTGTPPFANVDFVKRVLGDARATTIGAHPSPGAP